MKQNKSIIVVFIVLLLSVIPIIGLLHFSSKKEVTSRFQEQQLLHAHHLAEQIEIFFNGHAQVIRAFSTPVSLQNESMKQLQLDLMAYSRNMRRNFVSRISLYDEFGRAVYTSDKGADGLNEGGSDFFIWGRDPRNKDAVCVFPSPQGTEGSGPGQGKRPSSPLDLRFILAGPIYVQSAHVGESQPKERFLGMISFTVELKPFFISELQDAPMLFRDAWIIEQGGRLLFHAGHPEMALENINQTGGKCGRCHHSFDYVNKILEKREGTLSFETDSPLKKIASFSPMDFQNASWVVVVDEEDERVTSFIKRSFLSHLSLFAITVLFAGAGFVLIKRSYQAEIRAAEEAKHLQERLTERKEAAEKLKESEERLRYLSAQLLTAQEDERGRISRELHDELGQALATCKLRIGFISKKTSREQVEIIRECEETMRYIDEIIENVRRLSRDLAPAVLEHFGLSVALRRLLDDFAAKYNVELAEDMIDIDPFVTHDARAGIYRIFQEILNNIGKHAGARHVSVSLVKEGGDIFVTLADDGRGFDTNAVAGKDVHRKGLGLDILAERVRMLGGTIEVTSREGSGTRIAIRIPAAKGGTA